MRPKGLCNCAYCQALTDNCEQMEELGINIELHIPQKIKQAAELTASFPAVSSYCICIYMLIYTFI